MFSDLFEVCKIACTGMVLVLILGSYYDTLVPKNSRQLVECSVTIVNMAKKLNVTLVDKCEV
jgi:hypothetical protein